MAQGLASSSFFAPILSVDRSNGKRFAGSMRSSGNPYPCFAGGGWGDVAAMPKNVVPIMIHGAPPCVIHGASVRPRGREANQSDGGAWLRTKLTRGSAVDFKKDSGAPSDPERGSDPFLFHHDHAGRGGGRASTAATS